MQTIEYTVFQKILIAAGGVYVILVLVVYLFLKSIGEETNRTYLHGSYTGEDLDRWSGKIETGYSRFLFGIVKRIRNFGLAYVIIFIVMLVIGIILRLLGYDPMTFFIK